MNRSFCIAVLSAVTAVLPVACTGPSGNSDPAGNETPNGSGGPGSGASPSQISCGGQVTATSHCCAVTAGGGAKCWGSNEFGQLGDGSVASAGGPVDVVGLTSGVRAVAAGGDFSCAVLENGSVKCWGRNVSGQLGNGSASSAPSPTPVDVAGLPGIPILSITAGERHACIANGSVYCWGDNIAGQLGDGTQNPSPVPVRVPNLAGAQQVAAGESHTCVRANNAAQCWGSNSNGQLGRGPFAVQPPDSDFWSPAPVVGENTGLLTGVLSVSTGRLHTCALTSANRVVCWGDNQSGQLGFDSAPDPAPSFSERPVAVTGVVSATVLETGENHACAIDGTSVKCWGDNRFGQVDGSGGMAGILAVTVPGITGAEELACAGGSSCARIRSGGVECWGLLSDQPAVRF